MIGVRADGRKELVALADGYRESSESWADLLRDCARRGMRAPVLAIGDGALGFWGALREVFPTTREQRCWFHYADLRIMPTWTTVGAGHGVPGLVGRHNPGRSEEGQDLAGWPVGAGPWSTPAARFGAVSRGPVGAQVAPGAQSRLWNDHAASCGARPRIPPPPGAGRNGLTLPGLCRPDWPGNAG